MTSDSRDRSTAALEELHQRLRQAVDPKELANPGKMLAVGQPVGEAPARTSHKPHPLEQRGVISRA